MGSLTKEQLMDIFSRQGRQASLVSYKEKLSARATEIVGRTSLADYVSEIRNAADELSKKDITSLPYSVYAMYKRTGNRLAYESLYFTRRKRLCAFAIMSWLYGKAEDISQLEDIIWAICDESTWALPAHVDHLSDNADAYRNIDLFCAETAFYLAEIIFLVGERLDNAVINRVKREIFARVLDQIIEGKQTYNWEHMKNNWCAVCAGSVGAAAIYMVDDDETLAAVLSRLNTSFDSFMDSFEDDGACTEGLSYWSYGMSFYVAYMDLLSEVTLREITLPKSKKFLRVARFQQNMYLGGECTVAFSDSTKNEMFRLGLTCKLSSECEGVKIPPLSRVMGFNGDSCYRFAPILRDLLWGEQCAVQGQLQGNSQSNPEAEIIVFENAQWLICKNENESALGLCAKGGYNDEPHNHNDIGSFAICKGGKFLLSDIGAGEYTAGYFGDSRYEIFCNSSYSHSVPIIDGKAQKHGKDYTARDTRIDPNGEIAFDISPCYDVKGLQALNRVISYKNDGQRVEITDSFRFIKTEQKHNITERFITEYSPHICDGYVEISADSKNSQIKLYYDNTLCPEIKTHNHTDHEGNPKKVYSIDFAAHLESNEKSFSFIIE